MDKRLRFMRDLIQPMRIAPGTAVKLSRDHDPAWTGPVTRPEAGALLEQGVELLAEYQDRLAAQNDLGLLILLQGLDAAGKDSTIKHVMSGVNPQGVTDGQQLQAAVGGGAQPRLPLALPGCAARPGKNRHLQPVSLRRGTGRPGASRAARGREATRAGTET